MMTSESASAHEGDDDNLLQERYRITRCLGSGGMGDVYLAEDTRLGRLVAVKSLKQEFCKMTEVRKRIERECVMHAQLGAHPNIITLYDRVEEDDQIHLIIEYVDGATLKDIVEKARLGSIFLSWRESVSIACQVLDALARIHAQGIVHRDVKPANIMITQSDTGAYTAKLMDFGIARLMNPVDGATMLTRQGGSGPGTPIYMSPEQIAGTQFGPLSPASDIYALGIVLFQMLAKRPPFHGTITDIFHGHLNTPPPAIDAGLDTSYPTQLTEVVHKALAKLPGDRYASAVEFRRALKNLSRAHGVVTTLTVADKTAPVQSGATVPVAATVPMPPAVLEPVTTSWLFRRRAEGAKSASRTVVAAAIVLAAVAAAVIGNVLFLRSFTKPEPQQGDTQQAASDTAPPAPPVPVGQVQPPAELPTPVAIPANATPPVAPAPAAPEQPAPVTMDNTPPTAEQESTAPPEPKPAAPKPRPEPSRPSSVEPPDNSPEQSASVRATPKQEPERTPIPVQTPVPPDLSPPTRDSEPFSERARRPAQEVTPIPRPQTPVPAQQFAPGSYPRTSAGSTDIYQNMQVNKKPAVKVH